MADPEILKPSDPGGVDDEDLVLITVVASQVEYWNVHDGEMVRISKMARAALMGTVPTDLGEHGAMHIGGRPEPIPMR